MTRYGRVLWAMILLIGTMLLSENYATSSANQQGEDPHVRVSLFIDMRGTVSSVELSSASRIRWTFAPHHEGKWEEIRTDTLRAGLDQYLVRLLETRDLAEAARVAEQAGTVSDPAYILQVSRDKGYAYQVATGPYPSHQIAQAAYQRLANHGDQGSSGIISPSYWEVGLYEKFTEAEHAALHIQQQGVDAWPVVTEREDGRLAYAVWVEQNAEDRLVTMLPDLERKAAPTSNPYNIIRDGRLIDGTQAVHLFAGPEKTKIVFDAPDDLIQVKERQNRSYRGMMELSAHNNRLALINELPLETYLVSVVGVEMGTGWPAEALKAQAVAARTFVLKQGNKYEIAHVSDTTYDQAYYGIEREAQDVAAAVQATRGEVLVDDRGMLIDPLYHANGGGLTANSEEIWGNEVPYLRSVSSLDHGPERNLMEWIRVVLDDGTVGYVRSDYVIDTGETNEAGLQILGGTENQVNLRAAPFVNNETNPPIAQIGRDSRMVEIERQMESNAYRWVRGPFPAAELQRIITLRTGLELSEGLQTLEISELGESGRVQEMKANGKVIPVSSPDAHRTALGGLLSTKFQVEETGHVAVIGAQNSVTEISGEEQASLHILSADQKQSKAEAHHLFAFGGVDQIRYITRELEFRFIGQGYGHGLGMSQWGARTMAEEQGLDYQSILTHYYHNVSVERKERMEVNGN